MKPKQPELSRLYHAALEKYLEGGPASSMKPAHALGRRALALGLETLELARIHEIAVQALVPLDAPAASSDFLIGQAGLFFAETIVAIEKTHRGAREADLHLSKIVKTLSQRTLEQAVSVKEQKQEISQRKAVEETLRLSQQTTSNLLEKSHQMQEELRHLSRQLLAAQEEERRKISRELHDVIAQTLTGIILQLATLKAASTSSTRVLRQKISSTQRLVAKSVDMVHLFARELRPSVLDDFGLIPALESYVKGFAADTGIRVTLTAFAGIEQTSSSLRTALYRIAQEALTNVARHAKASHAAVTIEDLDGSIRMAVKDDGCGFAVDGQASARKHNRLGMLGMRERIEMIGGVFHVDSAPGGPTTIRVEIPAKSLHQS
ncbi:MAG: histidine kinase [Prosthecobacter sp.]|nr:histidine kinase [Prosthecobacter sp.]